MVFMRYGMKTHPYFDDVDEYYLGLSQETEYEKETSTSKEKESVKTNSSEREHLKTKISSNTHQFVNPHRVFVPKRKRGTRELGFSISKETQRTDQEAKSTSSVDEFVNPPEMIAVPRERRAKADKFVKKTNYCITTDQEDDPRSKIKRQEKKTYAGKKRILKRQNIDNCGEKSTKKGKRMGMRVDFKKLGLHPPPNFSSQIKSRIDYQEGRDSEIKLRIMKQLFQTDMDKHQDRFSMPLNQIDHPDGEEFLNKSEMEDVCRWKSKGIEVKLVEMGIKDDNYVHESTMRLRRWQVNNSSSYMLTSNWHDVLDRNDGALKLNDIVQVYSFRRDDDKLWLVLLKVMDADQVGNVKGINNEDDGVGGEQTVQGC